MPDKQIIVPLDGSSFAERALPLAAELAQRIGAETALLTVLSEDDGAPARREAGPVAIAGLRHGPVAGRHADRLPYPAQPERVPAEDRASRYLHSIADSLQARAAPTTTCVASGAAEAEIVAFARRIDADIIVMATHGRSGLIRGVLGSVTDRVITSSSIPVLVVPSGCAMPAAGAPWAVETIVVPLDGSELAETALPHAAELARSFSVGMTVLRALRPRAMDQEAALARSYLDGVAMILRAQGIDVVTEVAHGDPRREIPDYTERYPDSIVAMTTRGASGLTRWLRGSVADAVVRSVAVPAMIIPNVRTLLGTAIH